MVGVVTIASGFGIARRNMAVLIRRIVVASTQLAVHGSSSLDMRDRYAILSD